MVVAVLIRFAFCTLWANADGSGEFRTFCYLWHTLYSLFAFDMVLNVLILFKHSAEIETRTRTQEKETTLVLPAGGGDVDRNPISRRQASGWMCTESICTRSRKVPRVGEDSRNHRSTTDSGYKAERTRPSRANKSMVASAICRCTFKLKMGKTDAVTAI